MEYHGTYEEFNLVLPEHNIGRFANALNGYITHGLMSPEEIPDVDPHYITYGKYASNGRGWLHIGSRPDIINDERIDVVVYEFQDNGNTTKLRIRKDEGLRKITGETLTDIIEANPFINGKILDKKEKVEVQFDYALGHA